MSKNTLRNFGIDAIEASNCDFTVSESQAHKWIAHTNSPSRELAEQLIATVLPENSFILDISVQEKAIEIICLYR